MDIQTLTIESDNSGLLKRLSHFDNAPKKLYFLGSLPIVSKTKVVTIVGSRSHHPDSKILLEKIIMGLSGYPITIVSGLALGIDGIAHKTALKYNMSTIAFPGSGLRDIYPASHYTLSKDIVRSGGCLISEFSPATKAARWTFPLRNRLMAQCADIVLVVEASESSGTLITARHALDAGVTLAAIPHSPLNKHAQGNNKLLQDGAHVVLDYTDVLRLLGLEIEQSHTDHTHLSAIQQSILQRLCAPMHKQELYESLDIAHEVFIQTISQLEIGGYISERMGVLTRL